MKKYGIEECRLLLEPLPKPLRFFPRPTTCHYKCVSSIAFIKPTTAIGIIINCLQGCDFLEYFRTYDMMYEKCIEHFEKKHPNTMKWSGFCSHCSRYAFDLRKLKKLKLTIKDELRHIEKIHILSQPMKENASKKTQDLKLFS